MATYQLPFSGATIQAEIQQLVDNAFANIMASQTPDSDSNDDKIPTTSWVNQVISTLSGLKWVVESSLPTASASTMNKVYLVPDATVSTLYNQYMTRESDGTYSWVQLGSLDGFRRIHVSTDIPTTSDGNDGDMWLVYR